MRSADSAATLALVMRSVSPWPPATTQVAGRIETNVGLVTLYFTPDARMSVTVNYDDGEAATLLTGVLKVDADIDFKVAVRCHRDPRITVAVSGEIVGDTNSPEIGRQEFIVRPASSEIAPADFEVRNAEARSARVQALAKRRPRLGRQTLSIEDLEAALRREIDQLEDLLTLCREGRLYHVFGIAARLRLLVVHVRNGHPLLQLVAAHRNESLTLWAHDFVVNTDEALDSFGGWPLVEEQKHNRLEVDLDVWLSLSGAKVAGTPYTNDQILAAVGNTVAAHFDPDLEPLVGVMDSIVSGTSAGALSELERWVINTGFCIKELAKRLLAQYGRSPIAVC